MKHLSTVLLVALLAIVGGTAVHADEDGLSEKEQRARLSKLRTRATEWASARKKLVGTCPRCKGAGFVIEIVFSRTHGIRQRRTCPTCEGRFRVVYTHHYRRLYYDLLTPAFRSQAGIKDKLELEYRAANLGNPWPMTVKKFQIKKRELVDDTHGIAWVTINGDQTWSPMYWIWTSDEEGKESWYLHTEETDGPWPVVKTEIPTTPLSDPQRILVAKALAPGAARVAASEVHLEGSVLVVCLRPVDGVVDPERGVAAAGVEMSRALLGVDGGWESLRLVFEFEWRDELGRVLPKPTWIASLARERCGQTVWANLSAEEQARVLEWTQPEYPGWIRWRSAK